jgi:hypothetical protein
MSEFHDDDNDTPMILLSEPILLTKNSNPTLISKFLLERISLASNKFDLDYEFIKEMRLNKGAPYIRCKYHLINIF